MVESKSRRLCGGKRLIRPHFAAVTRTHLKDPLRASLRTSRLENNRPRNETFGAGKSAKNRKGKMLEPENCVLETTSNEPAHWP